MNKKARIALWCFFVFTLIVLISIMYFVFAAHQVLTSIGGTALSVNEDVQNWYNITVNNTNTVDGNITQVNITLPSDFLFSANSNGTSNDTSQVSALGLFVNTSATNTLSWTNATAGTHLITNNSWINFWFNASASTPGMYNLTINITNATGVYTHYINVTVNDTTKPSAINFTGQTPANNTILVQSNIPVNITATDNGVIKNITVRLYNASNYPIDSNSSNSAASIFFANFTNLADGTYYINATVNDTYGNNNNTETRTITLDTNSSVITLISPANGNITVDPNNVPLAFNVSDSSATNCTLILNGLSINFNSSVNITSGTNNFVNSTLSLNNTWYVNCTDNVNNKANSSTWSFAVTSFEFNGTSKDEDGNILNAAVINITTRVQQGWSVVGYTSTISNDSGWFNLSVPSSGYWTYEPSIIHRNGSFVDYKSKSIPAFPSTMMTQFAGTNFYLTLAGTINITAINQSGGRTTFNYQIKDTKLGYPVAEDHSTQNITEVLVYVPRNRNYTIMLYPYQNMPVSFDWNNFSASQSYNISLSGQTTNISKYDFENKTLHKQFNTSMSRVVVSGYANASGINWANFTVIPYILEAGMVHSEYGDMPYNMSTGWQETDNFNNNSGFYNLSLPGPVETAKILLFATAVYNNSVFYGGFRNISLNYTSNALSINFTMYGLLGTGGNITMQKVEEGGGTIGIPTAKQTFSLVNATNSTLTSTFAHIETTVDYSSYGALEFKWMSDVQQSQATATFALPLINATGIKEINVFASGGPSGGNAQYAPRRVSTMTVAQITTNSNITIRNFNPQDIEGAVATGSISIALFVSNSSCDVPNPATSCYLGGPGQNMATFNPMRAVMGGGKISFRMGVGGILIHYVNVDMLASGPPDALFENDAGTSERSDTFSNAVKFGSQGPTIYDYVLVSMPYTEGSSSTTGLNESATVSISIPILYDDNWGIIWNTTANGIGGGALAGNYSHYSAYQNDWGNLTAGKTCTPANITTSSQINSTSPCYIDNSSNRIWIRIPHFSGTGPTVTGSLITAAGTTTTPSTGGGGGTAPFWTTTYTLTDEQFTQGYTQALAVKGRIKFLINNSEHYAGIVALTSTTATINVSSTPQQATLSIGDIRRFDVTEDGYYDLNIKLNSIANNKANVTVKSIHEKVTEETKKEEEQKEKEATGIKEEEEKLPTTKTYLWIIAIVIALIIIILIYYAYKKKRR